MGKDFIYEDDFSNSEKDYLSIVDNLMNKEIVVQNMNQMADFIQIG